MVYFKIMATGAAYEPFYKLSKTETYCLCKISKKSSLLLVSSSRSSSISTNSKRLCFREKLHHWDMIKLVLKPLKTEN